MLALAGCVQAASSLTPTVPVIPTFAPTSTYPSQKEMRSPTSTSIANIIDEIGDLPLTAIETQIVTFPFVCDSIHRHFSPDEKWMVLICDSDEKPRMIVEN